MAPSSSEFPDLKVQYHLFSAGSVAMRDGVRGGHYVLRALLDIEDEMREAAKGLDQSLLEEYWIWGWDAPPELRLRRWLEQADRFARGQPWKPSDHLFLETRDD